MDPSPQPATAGADRAAQALGPSTQRPWTPVPSATRLLVGQVEGNSLTDSNVVWLRIGCTGDRPPLGSIDKVFDDLLVKVSVPFGGQYSVCWCLAEDDCDEPVTVDV